jgi:cytoskeleton protein RodZ
MSREEQQEIQVTGPGQILKSARLTASLSIQDIAKKIHLKSVMIEDIEADKYDSNISLTFIKGYIKLYAKQVSVPESEIMAAFESINIQKKEPAKLQSFSRRVAHQANDDKLMLVTYFILAVVFALVVVWWLQQGESDNTDDVTVLPETTYSTVIEEASVNRSSESLAFEEPSVSQPSTAINEKSSITDDSDLQALSSESEKVVLNNIPDQLADVAVQQVQSDSTESQVAETVELVFTFSEDCWMNLSDATGENIAYGVKAAGRVMPVSGLPPFVVTLGAPQVVQIKYAGEAVDMSVFKAGNTAKFTLPLAD